MIKRWRRLQMMQVMLAFYEVVVEAELADYGFDLRVEDEALRAQVDFQAGDIRGYLRR